MENKYLSKCWEACQYAVSWDGEAANIEDVVLGSLWDIQIDPQVVNQVIEACEYFGHKDIALEVFKMYNIL